MCCNLYDCHLGSSSHELQVANNYSIPNDGHYDTTQFTGSEGVYLLPHHQKEIIRLQTQHNFMKTTTAGVLLATPNIAGTKPLRILDAGAADGEILAIV